MHFFHRQLNFRSKPRSCVAIFEDDLETAIILSAETGLIESSRPEISFGAKDLREVNYFGNFGKNGKDSDPKNIKPHIVTNIKYTSHTCRQRTYC